MNRVEEVKTEVKWNYAVLNRRYKELLNVEGNEALMELDCLAHLFECEGLRTYEKIALFCRENGIGRAFDIGCANGHQSETFLQAGIDYVGICEHPSDFWNKGNYEYLVRRYPCQLPVNKGGLGVSVLCLTWNCYLYEGDKTLKEQCEALKRDFEHCLLYLSEDKVEFVSQYFKSTEKLDMNLYYFSNK